MLIKNTHRKVLEAKTVSHRKVHQPSAIWQVSLAAIKKPSKIRHIKQKNPNLPATNAEKDT